MSSIGLYQTAETYYGSNGYSLRLRGLDPGFNDNALSRAIVMHGAPYVSQAIADRLGRLGRSWGCPAVRQEVARTVIDTLKGGALLFAYYPDRNWLAGRRSSSAATNPAEAGRRDGASDGLAQRLNPAGRQRVPRDLFRGFAHLTPCMSAFIDTDLPADDRGPCPGG